MSCLVSKQSIREFIFLTFYVAIIIGVLLPRSIIGMEMEDEGWILTAYQNIFTYPSFVSYNFLYYNGIVGGGIWNLLFGQYGLISFRILHVLVEVTKALLVYFLLRKYCNRYAIALGYIILSVIFGAYRFMDHNQVTSLLCLIAIFFIVKSFEKKQWQYMLAGGAIVGINIFTRIPNISLCALILVLVVYWTDTRDNRLTFQLLLAALGGFVIGCVAELLLMACLGHLSIFVENISSGFAASGEIDSTHNLKSMGQLYLTQLSTILCLIAIIALTCYIYSFIKKKLLLFNYTSFRIIVICLSILIFVLSIIALYDVYFKHRLIIGNILYATQTIICLYIILRAPSILKYIAGLALIFIYMMPLGSDFGYDSSIIYQAMCLACPLTISYIISEMKDSKFIQNIAVLPLCLFMTVILGFTICRSGKYYIETWKVLLAKDQHYEIHSPLATTIIVQKRFVKINPLLDEMTKYARPGDVVLCFQSLAMIHYLTQTRPYLGNAWPWTYTSVDMEKHFDMAQKESRVLPVVIREKGWVLDILNQCNYPDWDNSNAEENGYHINKKIRLIQDFLRENNYTLAWEDNVFQILIPPHVE